MHYEAITPRLGYARADLHIYLINRKPVTGVMQRLPTIKYQTRVCALVFLGSFYTGEINLSVALMTLPGFIKTTCHCHDGKTADVA